MIDDTHPWEEASDYDVEKLREAAGIDKIETPDPTHKCQKCGWYTELDDYKRHAPNWCKSCESVTTFERLG